MTLQNLCPSRRCAVNAGCPGCHPATQQRHKDPQALGDRHPSPSWLCSPLHSSTPPCLCREHGTPPFPGAQPFIFPGSISISIPLQYVLLPPPCPEKEHAGLVGTGGGETQGHAGTRGDTQGRSFLSVDSLPSFVSVCSASIVSDALSVFSKPVQ